MESYTDVWLLNDSGCGVLIYGRRSSSNIFQNKPGNWMFLLDTTYDLDLSVFDF